MTRAPETGQTKSESSRSLLFENERALQRALVGGHLGPGAQYPVCFIRPEVPVGSCIPDIVCVRFAAAPRIDLIPSKFTFRHAFVLSVLRNRSPLRAETIAANCFEPPEKLRPVVEELAAEGALIPLHTRSFALSPLLTEIETEVVAIEAKLRRWKDALRQAEVYRRFADRVGVAMDARGIPSQPEALEQFRLSGIGLCSVTHHGTKWLVKPEKVPDCRGPEWEYLVCTAPSPSAQTLWTLR